MNPGILFLMAGIRWLAQKFHINLGAQNMFFCYNAGGIMRCDVIAKGIVGAAKQVSFLGQGMVNGYTVLKPKS
jgi:succinyl-CoA synthetase beta subunit